MIIEIFGIPASGKTVAAKKLEEYGVKVIRGNLKCLRYIFTMEFFSFMRICYRLPKGRFNKTGERIRSKMYILYTYLNIIRNRKNKMLYYSFSGFIEQIGGFLWRTDEWQYLAFLLKRHIEIYMVDTHFLYLHMSNKEQAYNRMMEREGKVRLCNESRDEAIVIIDRLIKFFDCIAEISDAYVIDTQKDIEITYREVSTFGCKLVSNK